MISLHNYVFATFTQNLWRKDYPPCLIAKALIALKFNTKKYFSPQICLQDSLNVGDYEEEI